MGCNCRKAKSLKKALTREEQNNPFARIIQGMLIFVFLIVMLPITVIYLFISYVIKGSFSIKIPNFISKKLM